MSNFFFKGGRADHKARAFATDCHRDERVVFSGISDSLIGRPSDVAAFDDVLPLNTKGLGALGMVERFVDATGLKLRGYENRSHQVEPDLLLSVSFAADPRYASLRLDLCSGGIGKIVCRLLQDAPVCDYAGRRPTRRLRCSVQPVFRMRRERLVSVRHGLSPRRMRSAQDGPDLKWLL